MVSGFTDVPRGTLRPFQEEDLLRTFVLGEDLISTHMSTRFIPDPTDVDFVESGSHDGNLYPVEVKVLPDRDPIPESARGFPGEKRYGYPLCFSRPGYEWVPYLPAVSSFHYPIFRGMKSARIINTGGGWRLRDEDILLWTSVEYVILKAIHALASGQLESLDHVTPDWPESFGYKRLHSQERFAVKAKTASLNAFRRMLAYCSYTLAGMSAERIDALSYDHKFLLGNPGQAEYLFKTVRASAPNTDIHILLKFLFASLGEIRRTANFTGVVVSYHKPYHYPLVLRMSWNSVPVYVRWNKTMKLRSYESYDQHHLLKDWAPNIEDFKVLEETPLPSVDLLPLPPGGHPQTSRLGARPSLPIQRPAQRFTNPMEYVRQRTVQIKAQLANTERSQAMRSRQRSAMKFGLRSVRGADVYLFERKEEAKQNAGEKVVYWERTRLNRSDAAHAYETAHRRQLWYVVCVFCF